jgi:hypothetical protein
LIPRKKKLGTMAPRRRADRPIPNLAMEREMRELRSCLDAMVTTQRREDDVGDISEAKSEEEGNEEVVAEDAAKE